MGSRLESNDPMYSLSDSFINCGPRNRHYQFWVYLIIAPRAWSCVTGTPSNSTYFIAACYHLRPGSGHWHHGLDSSCSSILVCALRFDLWMPDAGSARTAVDSVVAWKNLWPMQPKNSCPAWNCHLKCSRRCWFAGATWPLAIHRALLHGCCYFRVSWIGDASVLGF